MLRELSFSTRALIPYRFPLSVNTVRAFQTWPDQSTYPVCPRCEHTMEREYQAFCSRCGQKLSWRRFAKAEVVLFSAIHNLP